MSIVTPLWRKEETPLVILIIGQSKCNQYHLKQFNFCFLFFIFFYFCVFFVSVYIFILIVTPFQRKEETPRVILANWPIQIQPIPSQTIQFLLVCFLDFICSFLFIWLKYLDFFFFFDGCVRCSSVISTFSASITSIAVSSFTSSALSTTGM